MAWDPDKYLAYADLRLRPALDLEPPHRIGTADHLVDLRVLGRHRGHRQCHCRQ